MANSTRNRTEANQIGAQDNGIALFGNRNNLGTQLKEAGAGDLIYNAGMSQGDFAALISPLLGSLTTASPAQVYQATPPAVSPSPTPPASPAEDDERTAARKKLLIIGAVAAIVLALVGWRAFKR
jgi:hypothetical protein